MSASSTNLRNKRGINNYSIYRNGNNILFVPNEAMLLVHDESTEMSIIRRIGRWNGIALRWRQRNPDKPWLMNYLYNQVDIPTTVDFTPTEEMRSFRKEAQVESIVKAVVPRSKKEAAARRKLGLGDGGLMISTSTSIRAWVKHWRKHSAEEHPWFESWLLRGQRLPPNVALVCAKDIRRHTLAFDYVSHCEKAGLRYETYLKWLGKKRWIRNPSLLKWLYGAAHSEGIFFVTPQLQALRRATTQARLLRIAGTNDKRFAAWQQDPALKVALDEAICAADAGTLERETPKSLMALSCERAMVLYAQAQTLEARCKVAGISIQVYEQALREAAHCNVQDELVRYIKSQPPYEQTSARKRGNKLPQYGLVKPSLFIPTDDMWKFRKIASQEWSKQKIPWTGYHPAFEAWFLDWTTSEARQGAEPFGVLGPNRNGQNSARSHCDGDLTVHGDLHVRGKVIEGRNKERKNDPEVECNHSDDFTSVVWFGKPYRFAKGQQAETVKCLWESWEKGTPTLSKETIQEKIGSASDEHFKIQKIFRTHRAGKLKQHPAWGTMIVSTGKGIYGLNEPKNT